MIWLADSYTQHMIIVFKNPHKTEKLTNPPIANGHRNHRDYNISAYHRNYREYNKY